MAVPLLDKGVVVVAVGYDIAPKGTPQVLLQPDEEAACPPSSCASLFSGNMDLMVSQVRRSVVSVVQQYSHIRCRLTSTTTHRCPLTSWPDTL